MNRQKLKYEREKERGGAVWGRFYRADPAGNVVGYAGSVTIKINDFFSSSF